MDLQNTLSRIKQLIGEGNIEQALEQLVQLLDSDPKYGELAQAARVNQGELYHVKSQTLKSTIAPEDARLATNQIADNTLQIIGRLAAGKLTFQDPEPKPTHSQAWRYYVIGGVVTLLAALIAWNFFSKKAEECPNYSKDARYRVMILPFKQTGGDKGFTPEFDIQDGLNKLIGKTPGLSADADVNEGYNIDKNYPSFAEAIDIARNCSAQMIVWGKINRSNTAEYKMDVFYKMLDDEGVQSSGDTSLSQLLKNRDEGQQLNRDADAVTNLLYIVLANQARVPVLAGLLDVPPPPAPNSIFEQSASDTSWMFTTLALAENFKNNKQFDKAIQAYDQVLEVFPENQEARQKRGALLYQNGDFAGAARDLELAAPAGKVADANLLRIRSDAALKSGNPAKAVEDLNQLRRKSTAEVPWVKEKLEEVRDTMTEMKKRLDEVEQKAKTRPRDTKAQVDAGKISAGLGLHEKALVYSEKAISSAPANKAGYELKVEALQAKGDTAGVQKTIRDAEKSGVNTKSIDKWSPLIHRLEPAAAVKRQ